MLEQDAENAWLDLDPAQDKDAMPQILGSFVSYRIAIGLQQGRRAFMVRTIRPLDRPDPGMERIARANGFSLHAGVGCEGHQKDKREPLCRYIARPVVVIPRPGLDALAGGYLRIPMARSGADILCDSRLASDEIASLEGLSATRIIVARDTEEFGRLHVHFPRSGFEITG